MWEQDKTDLTSKTEEIYQWNNICSFGWKSEISEDQEWKSQ